MSKDDHLAHVKTQMDIQNFIEYYIAQIYCVNTDWPRHNVRFSRKMTEEYRPNAPEMHDGRWRWLLYDTDFGFGWHKGPDFDMLEFATDPQESIFAELITNLFENEDFKNQFIRTANDHLNTTFQPENVIEIINRFADRIEPEVVEQSKRWARMKELEEWKENVEVLRKFAYKRPPAMVDEIKDFFDLDNQFNLLIRNQDPELGHIKVNGRKIPEEEMPFLGQYFPGPELEIEAVAYEGASFKKWGGGTPSASKTLTLNPEGDTEITASFEEDPDHIRNHSIPKPHSLEKGDYHFSSWSADAAAGTYPDNMIFHQYLSRDPEINARISSDYEMPYNLLSKSRIEGKGQNGFAFINTSQTQEEPRAGFMGSAMLGLDTRNRENIKLNWKAQTLNSHEREYAIRVRYRKGDYGPFQDLKDGNGNFVKYQSHSQKGHQRAFQDIKLPEELEGEERVYLKFKYYDPIGDTYYDIAGEGERAQLAITSISVKSAPRDEEREDEIFNIYPNPTSVGMLTIEKKENFTSPLQMTLFNISGQVVKERRIETFNKVKDYRVNLNDMTSGVYMLHLQGGEHREVKRLVVE